MNLTLKLFTSCIPVLGAKRSTICDVQRKVVKFIPNSMCQMLLEDDGKTYQELLEKYGKENTDVIKEYLNFIVDNEFGFWTSAPDLFPPINTKIESPNLIESGIIDVGENSNHNFEKLFKDYDSLGCKHIQIRFFCETDLQKIGLMLKSSESTRINTIELILKYSPIIHESELENLTKNINRICSIIVYSAPEFKIFSLTKKGAASDLIFLTEKIDSHMHCGNISEKQFVVNQGTFFHAMHNNSCLDKKISIDVNGDIKNCPSMNNSYGNLSNESITNIVKYHPNFKKVWGIKKDMIQTCKDCEFRYICTDCRAYKESDLSLEKPTKCSYDPYTLEWK